MGAVRSAAGHRGRGGERPRRLTWDRIYLNLGTRAAIPPIKGLREAAPLTHVEALTPDVLPATLLMIGGGYIGMEMAQAFRHLGSKVGFPVAGSEPGWALDRKERPQRDTFISDERSDRRVLVASSL